MKDSAPVSSTPSESSDGGEGAGGDGGEWGRRRTKGEKCYVSTCSCETETSALFSCGMVNTGM